MRISDQKEEKSFSYEYATNGVAMANLVTFPMAAA